MSALIRVKRCLALLFVIATLAACSSIQPSQGTLSDLPDNFGRATVTFPGFEEPSEVVYEIIDGYAIFEGDIILGEVDENGNLIQGLEAQGVVKKSDSTRWPNATVPFIIDSGVDANEVNAAIAHWEENTLIRFVGYNPAIHSNYLRFKVGDSSKVCSSTLNGMRGGEQFIKTRPDGTCTFGGMVHEIGHALGLDHEQNRGDRDLWVTIHWENIEPGYEFAFCRYAGGPVQGVEADYCDSPTVGMDVGTYGYDSIMHYAPDMVAKDPDACRNGDISKCTITPKNPNAKIGELDGLGISDIATINEIYAFTTKSWGSFCSPGTSAVCATGDFNGDGKADLVNFHNGAFSGSSKVQVGLSNGSAIYSNTLWEIAFCAQDSEVCTTGDFNGDGRDDIVAFHNGAYGGSNNVYVALSNGSSFINDRLWEGAFCGLDTEVCATGDFNGDGKDDIIAFHNGAYNGSSMVFVATSNGSSFVNDKLWHNNFCADGLVCLVGDMNGDGKDDIIAFVRNTYSGVAQNDVYVSLSTGSSFGQALKWSEAFCLSGQRCLVGDMDGDGKDDVIATSPASSGVIKQSVKLARSTGIGFTATERGSSRFCGTGETCMLADANGDQHEDIVTFTWSDGVFVDYSNLKNASE
jgi:hypothetical protein